MGEAAAISHRDEVEDLAPKNHDLERQVLTRTVLSGTLVRTTLAPAR